jgi:hypothetical protein
LLQGSPRSLDSPWTRWQTKCWRLSESLRFHRATGQRRRVRRPSLRRLR